MKSTHIAILLFIGLWIVLMLNGQTRFFRDPGTFFHTAVGEKMISEKRLIHNDEFTFSYAGKPWIAQQWLGECLMAFLNRLGGFDFLLLVTGTILAALFSFIFHRALTAGFNPLLAVLLIVLTIASCSHHFLIRPHLATMIFLALMFAKLVDTEAGKSGIKSLLWLIPLFIIWANVHGGMLGGCFTLVLTATGWIVYYFLGLETPVKGKSDLLLITFVVFGCCAAVLINPYGLELFRTWMAIMSAPAVGEFIQEHAGLLRVWWGWNTLLFGGFYIAAFLGTLPGFPRITRVIPLVWLLLAISRIRHAPLFALTATIALIDFWGHIRWVRWLMERGSKIFKILPSPNADSGTITQPITMIAGILIIIGLGLQSFNITFPMVGKGWVKPDENYWPIKSVARLQEYAAREPGEVHIFNEMLFGGFLTFHVPRMKLFIDDRCELCGEEGIRSYVKAENDHVYLAKLASDLNWTAALTIPGSGFDKFFTSRSDWRLDNKTPAANFFVKSSDGQNY